jgi:outer membrane protein OmpA-like peptidoglycan-associated protein
VVDYLISKGYDPNNISYKGYGFSNPVNDNSTVAKKALNRRVEIKLIKR